MVAGSRSNSHGPPGGGPSFSAPPMWEAAEGLVQSPTDEERALLSVIATVVRFKKGENVYLEGDPASAIFNITSGVIKLCKAQPGRKEHVVEFMFPNDLIGLAQNGQYVNSAKAVTSTALYRMPTQGLEARLRQNAGLEFHLITKLCQYLSSTERHAIVLDKHRASAKIGLFVQMLESHQNPTETSDVELYLPMTRADIGAYAGISPEAVSRSFGELVRSGAIVFQDRRHLRITDRAKLEAVIAETDRRAGR
jgi:CRP/FNR family transcriptional regulator, anaerobic regulatory protein